MQGWCSNSALFWALKKAGVRQPILISTPFCLGTPKNAGVMWSQIVASIGAHFVALCPILHPEAGPLPSVWTVGTCSPSCLEEHRSNH